MSQQQNITAYNAGGVAYTLVPDGIEKVQNTIVAKWIQSDAAVPVVGRVSFKQTKQRLPSGIIKVTARLEIPILEEATGTTSQGYAPAIKVRRVDTEEQIGYFHETAAPADRDDARWLMMNILSNVSTNSTPSAAGPVYDLFTNNIQPS